MNQVTFDSVVKGKMAAAMWGNVSPLVTGKDFNHVQIASGMSGLVETNRDKWSGVSGFTIPDSFVL